jgi:hypothetical protein
MTRQSSDNPASSLRAALASPFMAIRLAGILVLKEALGKGTFSDAARHLNMPRRTLERLRDDFPDDFKVEPKAES